MDWAAGLAIVLANVLVWALVGLVVAWLIKFFGKKDRLPRWPIYAFAAFGFLKIVIAAFLLGNAIEGAIQNGALQNSN